MDMTLAELEERANTIRTARASASSAKTAELGEAWDLLVEDSSRAALEALADRLGLPR